MQLQPTSVMLSADAYRRELLADAARVRPTASKGGTGPRFLVLLSRLRRNIGRALAWSGLRLSGGDAVGLGKNMAGAAAGHDAVYSN